MQPNTQPPKSLLFVLGTQRSGTTWVANLLDSSPHSLLFMEPFAPAYGLFPEMPDQAFFLRTPPLQVTAVLQQQTFHRLLHNKRLFSDHSLTDPRLFRIERYAARRITRYAHYLPARVERRVAQFTLLNLNRFENSFPLCAKMRDPPHWIIKELRFAGKITLLRAAFPTANYLVVLRSPHATVHSMLTWFKRGNLGEVKRELDSFVEKLECQRIGEDYAAQIAVARSGGIAHRAALYWRVCYEQMARTLQREQARFLLLPYEALASNPRTQVEKLFDWAGIPLSEPVLRYLAYSTSSTVENPSAINTVRRSDTYYASWLANIAPDVRQSVDEIVDGSDLLDVFEPFYGESFDKQA